MQALHRTFFLVDTHNNHYFVTTDSNELLYGADTAAG
jgi:hypothetical protein